MSAQYELALAERRPKERPEAASEDVEVLEPFLAMPAHALAEAGSLRALLDAPRARLGEMGVTQGEAARLHAALALGRRYIEARVDRGQPLTSPAA